MFSLDGEPLIERFELVLVTLRSPAGSIRIPLVDEWLELQLSMRRVPDRQERNAFFSDLRGLCCKVRVRLPDLRWYFLHKPPGLKLRFRVGRPDEELLDSIMSGVLGWNWPWLHAVAIGSYFDQAELNAFPYRADVERLLTYAADCHLEHSHEELGAFESEWADVAVALLERVGLDTWLAYEALARLGRLRATDLAQDQASEEPLSDPRGLLAGDLPRFAVGFEASLSFLQGLNLLFNIWGVNGTTQSRILTLACNRIQPAIVSLHR
jgi:hypothetical protein